MDRKTALFKRETVMLELSDILLQYKYKGKKKIQGFTQDSGTVIFINNSSNTIQKFSAQTIESKMCVDAYWQLEL